MSENELIDSGPALEVSGLIHRMHRPNGPGPHPTAVMLHGFKGDEDVMWIFARTLPAPDDWLVVAPRALHTHPDGGNTWRANLGEGWSTLADFEAAIAAVARLVHSLPGLYAADPKRVYLMGFSQGAALSLSAAAQQPGLAQGVAALMGFLPEDAMGEQAAGLKGLPVFLASGKHDQIVPIAMGRASEQAVRQAGAKVDYHEYEGGHKMSAPAMDDLKAWWRATT